MFWNKSIIEPEEKKIVINKWELNISWYGNMQNGITITSTVRKDLENSIAEIDKQLQDKSKEFLCLLSNGIIIKKSEFKEAFIVNKDEYVTQKEYDEKYKENDEDDEELSSSSSIEK